MWCADYTYIEEANEKQQKRKQSVAELCQAEQKELIKNQIMQKHKLFVYVLL